MATTFQNPDVPHSILHNGSRINQRTFISHITVFRYALLTIPGDCRHQTRFQVHRSNSMVVEVSDMKHIIVRIQCDAHDKIKRRHRRWTAIAAESFLTGARNR